jgi:hypothetical protein
MSYIGNQVTSVPHIIDTFTGTGTGTSFGPLTRSPAGTASIAVFITGSYQIPGVDYTLDGNYINFTSAPFNLATIVVHHLGNGTATQVPSDGSVTGTKLAINSVRGNNIVAGQITGNLIAANSISGNQIGLYAVSGNQISLGAITGNLIPNGAISGNNIVDNAIRGNNIVAGQITGNLIGTGAISANHYAGGGVTSEVLSSNLRIIVSRSVDSGNVNLIAPGGNINIDVACSTVYFFGANSTANMTFNLRGNSSSTFDSVTSPGQATSVVIAVKNGTTRYSANLFIDGTYIRTSTTPFAASWTQSSTFFAGNSSPEKGGSTSISNAELNVFSYTVFKTGTNQYSVLAGNTLFALG